MSMLAQRKSEVDVQVQLAALESIFGSDDEQKRSRQPSKELTHQFVSETARELAKVEQRSLEVLLRRLDQYDPEDKDVFVYLTRQVLERVKEEQALAAAIGVHPATLSRWAGRGGKVAVPPVFVRAAAMAAFAKILREGLEEMQKRYAELNEYMDKIARQKLGKNQRR